MIADKMKPLVENNSAIRTMFEEGKRMAALYGTENVYDFSLGNPNVPAGGFGYVGRIKNSGTQVVQAPIQTTVSKKGTVKTGNDLRSGKK